MDLQAAAIISAFAFGSLCIASALPFVGVPFPSKQTAEYYRRKSAYMAGLTGNVISVTATGYLGAALRVLVGVAVMRPETRELALAVNGAVVTSGTVLAVKHGRPLLPQFGMLVPMMVVFALGRLAGS